MNCENAFVPSRISLVTAHTMRAVSTTSRNYSLATTAACTEWEDAEAKVWHHGEDE